MKGIRRFFGFFGDIGFVDGNFRFFGEVLGRGIVFFFRRLVICCMLFGLDLFIDWFLIGRTVVFLVWDLFGILVLL